MSGSIRVNYIPQRPGIHELSVIMGNEHVSESPYLIAVDKKAENVTGQLSYGTPTAINVSRIRKEGRRYNVLLRIVDFVTEKMILTEDGKLKKLSPQNMVAASRISRQMAVPPSFDKINNSSSHNSIGETNGPRIEKGNISDIDRNMRDTSLLRMSPLNFDTKLPALQRHKHKRRDLDLLIDRLKKVVFLRKFFVKQNLSHNSFQILHSAEQFLDGRPVRLTDTTFNLIESALKPTIPQTCEDHTDERAETKMSESDVLKIERNLGSTGLTKISGSDALKTERNFESTDLTKISGSDVFKIERDLGSAGFTKISASDVLKTGRNLGSAGFTKICGSDVFKTGRNLGSAGLAKISGKVVFKIEGNFGSSGLTKISGSDALKTERNLGKADLTDKYQRMLMACECIASLPRRRTENESHTPTKMIHFSKLMCVEPNLSRVQNRRKTRNMWHDTKAEVRDNCSYDLNRTDSPTTWYDVSHGPKRKAHDADDPNKVIEVNRTKVKHNISSSCGEQCAKLWDEGLNVGTLTREISAPLVSSTMRYGNLKLETMSTVKFPSKGTQKNNAVLIPETAHMKVTDHKLQVDRAKCLIFMPQHLSTSHKYTIKSDLEMKCLMENENRRNAIVYESPEVITLIEHEVPFASVCNRRATFISPKKGTEVISLPSSPFLPQFDYYQGNKNEISVRLTQVLQTENANETVNYWICLITAFSSATGIECKDIECTSKISVSARRSFENTEICSTRDKYLQSVKHPAEVISIGEIPESQTEDEAGDKGCRARKHDESSCGSTWTSKNDDIKATEIFINEDNPSSEETTRMNSQARQTIGAESVDKSRDINISVMESEEEGTASGSHIWQQPTEDLVNIKCIRKTNNTSISTLLPQMLQEHPEDASLHLGTACERTCTIVKPAPARISCDTSSMFPYLEDTPSQNSTAYVTFSSDDELDQLFNLWSSDTRIESSPGVALGQHEDNALDFEAVLSAPNLQEALHLLDQMLRVIKERNTSDNVHKLSDGSVSTGQATVSPSPESCSTKVSGNADDNNIQFFTEGYGDMGRGYPNYGPKNISALITSKSCKKRNIVYESVKNQRKQQLSENSNAIVNRFKIPANEEIWGIRADEIKYGNGRDDYDTPLYADFTSNLVKIRHCPSILAGRAPIMTSMGDRNKENDVTDRYMDLDVHLQDNSEIIGNISVMLVSSLLTISEEQQYEAANIEGFVDGCKQPDIILEMIFTDMETQNNVVIGNAAVLQSESNSCAEHSGKTAREVMCISAVTEDMDAPRAVPALERNELLDNVRESPTCAVKIQARGICFAIDCQSDKFYYNKHEIKNSRQPLTQNIECSCNYTDYLPLDTLMQSITASGANKRQNNKINILDSFQTHGYIPEESKSITLEPSNAGAIACLDKNTKITEAQRESEQSPLAAFMSTVDVRGVSSSCGHSKMTEKNVTNKSNLLLTGFLTLVHENTLYAPITHSERVKETDNVTLSLVSNMLQNADKRYVKLLGEHENLNRDRNIIIGRQITLEITENITSRTLQMFSDTDKTVLSVDSNKSRAVNKQKHLSETEMSYVELGDLTEQKVQKICKNALPSKAPSHVYRRISLSLLPNTNIDFMGSHELFQENETVKTHEIVLTSLKRSGTPVGKAETILSLTKYSALQCEKCILSCRGNKNETPSLKEWSITARHPVTHSSQTDSATHSMSQIANDISRAISLPQPGVITKDMDILHPLVTKEIDPNGSTGETRHDNKLSNKIDESFDGNAKKIHGNKNRFLRGTEYLKPPIQTAKDIKILNRNFHQFLATNYYNSVAYMSEDNYVRRREIEMNIPKIIGKNINTIVTHENSVDDDCININCKLTDPEYDSFKGSMEKLTDKIQNDDTIIELKTITCIVRNDFMRQRSNSRDLLTSESINRFPECVEVTQEKEYWDEEWMKQNDWQDKQQVKINYTHDYSKYQQCYTAGMNQWSTNRRHTPVYRRKKVNTRHQAFPSPITCNKSAVVERKMYGSDLAGSQKTTNKYFMYKNIHMSRQELTQLVGLVRTGKKNLDGKWNIYVSQKGTDVHDDDGEFTSGGRFQNKQVLEQVCRYSSAALSDNFACKTSPILSSTIYLHKQSQIDFNDKINSCYITVDISLENEEQNEKLTSGTVNKQLQIVKEEDASDVPIETKDCDLNTMELERLEGTETDICRAKLVDITDDGYTVPTLPTMVLLSSQNNSVNMENFAGDSQSRTVFGFEQSGDEETMYSNHDESSTSCQLVYNKERAKISRELMSNEDITKRRLRFQRAKLFFQKFEQNTSK
jgi:hypothetical protein